MTTKETAKSTGEIVCSMLSKLFNPSVGNPYLTNEKGFIKRLTKKQIREIIPGYVNLTDLEFDEIFEGLEDSIFSISHHDGEEDTYLIEFFGLPWYHK